MKPFKNCETFEINLIASKTEYTLVDAKMLTGKKIIAIETYKVGDVPKAPSGIALAADAQLKLGFLQIWDKGGKVPLKNVPLGRLVVLGSDSGPIEFYNIDLDPSKSIIKFAGAVLDATCILLTVYYED